MSGYFYLASSAVIVIARVSWELNQFKGKVSPLAIYLFCYFYFCFGPYIALTLGLPVYGGIHREYLDEATFVFFVALLSLALFPSNLFGRVMTGRKLLIKDPALFRRLCVLLMIVPVIIVFAFAFVRIGFSEMNKVERVQAVGLVHYVVLTLWPLVLFSYLTVAPFDAFSRRERRRFVVVILLYSSYCLYMAERDIVLIAVPLFFWVYKDKTFSLWKMVGIFLAAGLGFTLMSAGRASQFETGGFGSFLNQGSNLMVTSNIIAWQDQGEQLLYGRSYFAGLIDMLTLGAIKLGPSLSTWFSRRFSSGVNDGAFGFSIEGEALLNFGVFGVPLIFFAIAFFLAWCYRGYRQDRPLGVLLTYFNLFYLLYAIRGESLIVFKAFIYCVIIFFALIFISQRGRIYFRG